MYGSGERKSKLSVQFSSTEQNRTEPRPLHYTTPTAAPHPLFPPPTTHSLPLLPPSPFDTLLHPPSSFSQHPFNLSFAPSFPCHRLNRASHPPTHSSAVFLARSSPRSITHLCYSLQNYTVRSICTASPQRLASRKQQRSRLRAPGLREQCRALERIHVGGLLMSSLPPLVLAHPVESYSL